MLRSGTWVSKQWTKTNALFHRSTLTTHTHTLSGFPHHSWKCYCIGLLKHLFIVMTKFCSRAIYVSLPLTEWLYVRLYIADTYSKCLWVKCTYFCTQGGLMVKCTDCWKVTDGGSLFKNEPLATDRKHLGGKGEENIWYLRHCLSCIAS